MEVKVNVESISIIVYITVVKVVYNSILNSCSMRCIQIYFEEINSELFFFNLSFPKLGILP